MANKTTLFAEHQAGGAWNITDAVAHPGSVFFVHAGTGTDAAGYGYNPQTPTATLDYAIANRCTASKGDVIYCLPGHAEALGADSAVDIDIVGVKVIGLGTGAARPTFTASVIAGDFKLAAANAVVENLVFLSGIDVTTGMVEVSAADCVIRNCEFRDSVDEATDCLITTTAADRLLIDNCRFIMAAGAGANTAIALLGVDDVEVRNCYIYGNFALGAIECRGTACLRLNIHDCQIWTENAADLAIKDLITGSSGWIGPNLRIMLQDNAANVTAAVTGATFHMIPPVYVVNAVAEKAMISSWTAVTNA